MIDRIEKLLKEKQPQDYIRIIENENENLYKEIDRLTNNWNELEEWLESEIKRMKELAPKHNIMEHFEIVLGKMKELEEKK